jgi:hypothetical protein
VVRRADAPGGASRGAVLLQTLPAGVLAPHASSATAQLRRLGAGRNACRDGDTESESENPVMTDPDDDPIEEILARSRDRAERFQAWLEQLRAGDPTFAEVLGAVPGT